MPRDPLLSDPMSAIILLTIISSAPCDEPTDMKPDEKPTLDEKPQPPHEDWDAAGDRDASDDDADAAGA